MMFLTLLPLLVITGTMLGVMLWKATKEVFHHLRGAVDYAALALQLLAVNVMLIVFAATWVTSGFLVWVAFQ